MKQNRLKRDWQGGFPDFRRVGVYLEDISVFLVLHSFGFLGYYKCRNYFRDLIDCFLSSIWYTSLNVG